VLKINPENYAKDYDKEENPVEISEITKKIRENK